MSGDRDRWSRRYPCCARCGSARGNQDWGVRGLLRLLTTWGTFVWTCDTPWCRGFFGPDAKVAT